MASAPSINLSSLNGTTGFRLDGAAANAGSGACVSSAGDVNGDGLADIIIGCFGPNSYVVFGQAGGFASSINLAGLDGSNGFRVAAGGPAVASAGDVNGDGLDDVIIGDTSDARLTGASYVVFGKASGFASAIAPSSLDGNNGFKLVGVAPFDLAGCSVASAGDVNGDGLADLIIGAAGAYSQTGASYVVFGKAGGFASSINLSSLDGTNGFQLVGVAEFDAAGGSVASAGDVNGDGFADLIIGASGTYEQAGASPSYLVFGKASGFDPSIDLSSLDGSSGFRLDGVAPYDYSGFSVASAGDVNGDGYSDLIIGAYGADPRGNNMAGSSYIVFGKPGGSASSINLGDLNGTTGFRLDGVAADDYSGFSVASAGDVNGDGFADLIIGAYVADPNGTNSGSSYLLFGKASGFASSINLSSLNGTAGFRLDGVSRLDWSGYSVASAGDVTGDGLPDLIIGAHGADPNGSASGSSYIYFSPATGGATYRGTTLADTLRGTAFADIMNGYASNDSINGGAGNDTIAGGTGNDTIDSGTGDDTVQWTLGDGNDTITLGSGTNVIDFGDNPYTYTDSGAQRVFTIGSATVTVTDWTTGSNSVVIYNHAPAVTSGSAATFAENDTGTVYTATGTDPDANTTLTWSLGGTDAAFFEIDPASGQVTFKTAPNFEDPADAGADNVYDITVTASDGSLSSAAQAVAITVTNANEAPSVTSGVSANFAENATGTVYTATGRDPDADPLSWSLGGTDAALFNINAATGDVSFRTSPDFEAPADAGQNNIYDITVTAFDGSLSSLPRAVAITVTDVKEATLGTQGPDTLSGTPQNDTLQGLGGDDGLFGLAGDDVLDGGVGDDLARLSGAQSGYRFGLRDGVVITSGADGVDQFSNIERFQWGSSGEISIATLSASAANLGLIYARMGSGPFGYSLPDTYTGPVPGIVNQKMGSSGGDIILGTQLADFINAGAGNDAIDGGAANDVIDGGLGSNFLTGGAGADIFFLDGRAANTSITWSTITDFQVGDGLTVWGYQPGISRFLWVAGDGATGYKGATLHCDLDGNGTTDTSVTFSGLTQSQLPTPSFGSIEGQDYIFFG